jgi:FkbM family methyltransferase
MNNLDIGSDRWLLKETKGNTFFDRFILNLIKLSYLSLRILLRLILGKTRRNKLWFDRKITFHNFLYQSIEFLNLDNSLLLVFEVPKWKFKFNTRINHKINNFLIHDVVNGMKFHEEELLQYFSPKEGDVVIDVGAAFGIYTMIASKKVGPKGKVVAIEPQPEIFKLLNCNIKLNKLFNVVPLNYATYSTATKLKLYSNYSVISERPGKNNPGFLEVSGNTLDYLISQVEEVKKINWIKIDVEGAEFEVLKGATGILSKSTDISLLIEIHNISNGKNYYDTIKKFLSNYNFKIDFEKIYDTGERHIIVRKQKI